MSALATGESIGAMANCDGFGNSRSLLNDVSLDGSGAAAAGQAGGHHGAGEDEQVGVDDAEGFFTHLGTSARQCQGPS